MSESYRTKPPRVTAGKRARRDVEGELILPRIIVRKPRRGDIHPILPQRLNRMVPTLPVEYLYGLRRIELLPRQTGEVGQPYGSYWTSEAAIVLYSVPPRRWNVPRLGRRRRELFEIHDARITTHGDRSEVHWPRRIAMETFFIVDTLFHELGHHYMYQYRTKRKLPGSSYLHEILADRHHLWLVRQQLRLMREWERQSMVSEQTDASDS